MDYKISLITPVYNAMQYIEEAFQSVKTQSIGFENIQWLLVDDGSTDGSYELLCSWEDRYPNIKVLRTPSNTGTPATPRNIALDNATAPYVMFLDNDDAFFPDAMKALYDEIESSGADIVTGDVELLNGSDFSESERRSLLNYSDGIALGKREMELPLGDWILPYLNNHWSKIYRRDIIEAHHIRCLDGELWEDILFLFLYMAAAKTMVHIDLPIVRYRVRRESLSYEYSSRFCLSSARSIRFGAEKAEAMGEDCARRYAELLRYGGHIEYCVDNLMAGSMSDEQLRECLMAWKPAFLFSSRYGTAFHSAYCKILEDDFLSEADDKALFHFFTLRELYRQRLREKEEILGSNTYKLAKKLADIKTRLTRGRNL